MHRTLVVSFFFFVAIKLFAQDTQNSVLNNEVSIQFDDVSLPTALRQLNREANLSFSYNSNIIPRNTRINESYNSVSVKYLLDDLLSKGNLYYREVNGTIVILKRIYSERAITGVVLDKETQEPLPFANVFIDNSTLGVPTDLEGRFKIDNIPDIGFNLVVSYVGYKSKSISFNYKQEVKDRNFIIEMEIDPIALEGIQVIGRSRKKNSGENRRLYKRFEQEFLGRSENAKDCEIINPDVLDFEVIDSLDNYKVTAEDILYIENRALGFRIGYLLEEFKFESGTKVNIGSAQFKELEPKSRRQYRRWEEAREQAYNGSVLHFLNALIMGRLEAEGFRVNIIQYDSVTSEYTTPLNPQPLDQILQIEKTEKEYLYRLKTVGDIEVTYRGEFEDDDYKKLYRSTSKSGNYKYTDKKARSSISLSDNQSLTSYQVFGLELDELELFQKSIIFFDKKETPVSFPGQFLSPRDVTFGGWWRWGAFSDVLPLNYRPTN
ncbi:carboxypeptidase-like regulatory domain-containing protein [Roseivirga spongicola]|uniref:carboxypeptidase-like regulatory domain-containing protein n=1 Tax=Roseivirga spongicola TaxID=333140 RepID=UPI002AC955BA|nr:carboxypeptidase-like regulatory domain-containing protein [Roseivirga spongicola]WPZ11318.1 carboxypeptidase-like regulatory domain-containing protein [Roseivirga spongicola]